MDTKFSFVSKVFTALVAVGILVIGIHYYVTYIYPKVSTEDLQKIKQADIAHWGGTAIEIQNAARFGPIYVYAVVDTAGKSSTREYARKESDGSFVLLGAWQEVPPCDFFVINHIPSQVDSQCADPDQPSIVYIKNPNGYAWW